MKYIEQFSSTGIDFLSLAVMDCQKKKKKKKKKIRVWSDNLVGLDGLIHDL